MKENADYLKEQKGKYVGLKFAFWVVFLKYVIFMLVTFCHLSEKEARIAKEKELGIYKEHKVLNCVLIVSV